MNDLLVKHIGEIADHLQEIEREQQMLIDSLYALLDEWKEYFNEG